MKSDVNFVRAAFQQRCEMLRQLFGEGKKSTKPPPGQMASALKNYARQHNALWKSGKVRPH